MYTHFCYTVFILALCLLLVSCGPPPQTGKMPPIPSATRSQSASTSAPMATRTAPATGALPATAAIDVTKKPLLKAFFKNEPSVNRLEDLYATTKGQVENLSVVSNCDLDALKAFVATGWAPIIQSKRSGKGHLSVVIKYDDAQQQIQIGNPINTRASRMLTYSEFGREWSTGSGNKCVLITPKKLNTRDVQTALKKYLPEEQVARIQVRSR